MILIFIQYGDVEARHIGLDFQNYLNEKGIDSFLAARESPNIPGGYPNWRQFLESKILESNVILAIVTEGYGASAGVQEELDIRDEKNETLPIIPCIKFGVDFPENLHTYDLWTNKFDPYKYKRYFDDWLIDCFKWVYVTR